MDFSALESLLPSQWLRLKSIDFAVSLNTSSTCSSNWIPWSISNLKTLTTLIVIWREFLRVWEAEYRLLYLVKVIGTHFKMFRLKQFFFDQSRRWFKYFCNNCHITLFFFPAHQLSCSTLFLNHSPFSV